MARTRNIPKDAPPVPITEDNAKLTQARADLETASQRMRRQLMREPMVKVNGNPMYRPYMGKTYTYMFNDIEVTINFDGKDYEYPKSIAENLTRKLAEIARTNTPVDMNERI